MTAENPTSSTEVRLVLAFVALGLCLLASFMPWAKVLFLTVNGTDGDGVLTMLLALAAGVLLFLWYRGERRRRGLLIASLVTTALGALVFLIDTFDVSRAAAASAGNDFGLGNGVDVGIGLYLGCVASIAAVVLEAMLLTRSPSGVVASAAMDVSNPAAPVWDAQRGAWVSFDATQARWLRYDESAQQWAPL
jgi:hypothetical protein